MYEQDILRTLETLVQRSEREGATSAARARDFDALADALAEGLAAPVGRPSARAVAAYLEGALSGDDLEAFHAALAASPDFREEIEALCDQYDSAGLNLAEEATAAGLQRAVEQNRALTVEQQRALFRDPGLRAAYNALVGARRGAAPAFAAATATLPRQIAASSGQPLDRRAFLGGALEFRPSGRAHLLRVEIRLDPGVSAGAGLLLRGPHGEVARLLMPPPEADGSITCVLDLRDHEDRKAAEMLRDPLSDGHFVEF